MAYGAEDFIEIFEEIAIFFSGFCASAPLGSLMVRMLFSKFA